MVARQQLRLSADTPGVVLSLLPHEHLSADVQT